MLPVKLQPKGIDMTARLRSAAQVSMSSLLAFNMKESMASSLPDEESLCIVDAGVSMLKGSDSSGGASSEVVAVGRAFCLVAFRLTASLSS